MDNKLKIGQDLKNRQGLKYGQKLTKFEKWIKNWSNFKIGKKLKNGQEIGKWKQIENGQKLKNR